MEYNHQIDDPKPDRRVPWNKGKHQCQAASATEPRLVDPDQAADGRAKTRPRAL